MNGVADMLWMTEIQCDKQEFLHKYGEIMIIVISIVY